MSRLTPYASRLVISQKHQGCLLIIFTVTNTVTNQVYVGSTRNDLEDQWDKMVVAAEQDLDYPLYRDIRRYGVDAFIREVYDMAEHRSELAELEQNAVEDLNAISLRGHKTSTVIIKKKTPVRRKASEAEKELLDLLDTFASDDVLDDLPEQEPKKESPPSTGYIVKNEPKPAEAAKPAPKPTPAITKFDALTAAKAIIAQAAREEEEKSAAAEAEVKAAAERSRRASRTTGNISIDLDMDDTINAQLAALTAAIDGLLAGDSSAASLLETQTRTALSSIQEQSSVIEQVSAQSPASEPEPEPEPEQQSVPEEVVKVVSEKDKRIIVAMALHREARNKRTSSVIEAETAQLQERLAELNQRVAAMPALTSGQTLGII